MNRKRLRFVLDVTAKPAYLAYATFARVLEKMKFVGPVDVGSGNFGFRFGPSRSVSSRYCVLEPDKRHLD